MAADDSATAATTALARSLTPTEDYMLSAAKKLHFPSAYRATDGEGGHFRVPGTLGRRRSASDLGVPRTGLGMNNLSGTHSSVPPLSAVRSAAIHC